jgi:hypothetical protein
MQTLLDLAVLVGVVRIIALLVQGHQDREMLVEYNHQPLLRVLLVLLVVVVQEV